MRHSLRLYMVAAVSAASVGLAHADPGVSGTMPSPEPYQLVKYPKRALKNGIEGCAYVSFMITSEGKTTNVEVEQSTEYFADAGKALFKKIRFAAPVDGANDQPIGPFHGLLEYGLILYAPVEGKTGTYMTDWKCPYSDMKVDLPAKMLLVPSNDIIFTKRFPLDSFKLIKVE